MCRWLRAEARGCNPRSRRLESDPALHLPIPHSMNSKKWRRRRPIIVWLTAPNGYHKPVRFRWEQWQAIEEAATITGETPKQFIERALRLAIR